MDGGRRAGRAVNVQMLRVAERGGWKSQAHGWRETGGKGSECRDAEGGRAWGLEESSPWMEGDGREGQ